jgi:hypothetical protein
MKSHGKKLMPSVNVSQSWKMSVLRWQELQENTSGVWTQVTIKMPGIRMIAFQIIGFIPID